MRPKIAVVAFGGNAMLPDRQRGLQAEQERNARRAAGLMVHIVEKGYELIIVHGNGPQVGNLLIQMEKAADRIPPFTLDVCGAMTEGSMGYMLERALVNELRRRSIGKEVASLVTQVVVDKDDPAFGSPAKPVGPFYSRPRARRLAREKGWTMVEDAGRGFRRVVPSPRPVAVVNGGVVRELVEAGRIVVVAGGGGVPVAVKPNGLLEGVEAVIDKDYAASLLAREVRAELFVILTAVARVYIDFGRPGQRGAPILTVDEARALLAEGQFPPGSMGPKVRAAVEYIEAGGREVLITKDSRLKAALANRSGTRIVASAA